MNLIFVLKTFNTPYFYIVAEPQRVFHSVLASRVIINVRKALSVDDDVLMSTKVMGSIRYRLRESIDIASGVTL